MISNYYAKQKANHATREGTTEGGFNYIAKATTTNSGLAASTAALVAAAGAGILGYTRAPVDQVTDSNMLHNVKRRREIDDNGNQEYPSSVGV
ncbi:hypothetical protein SOVF_137710 [Spinacia oleracea]|nr:hypothetical protein SOVF_137710 [Spinacia oleracea]